MNFGKQLPRLSKFLWDESRQSFEASETTFKKCLPLMFHSYCRMQLNLSRLLIYQSARSSQLDFSSTEKKLKTVESYGVDRLSAHTDCLLQLVKGELMYHTKQIETGNFLLTSAQHIAESNCFHQESSLCEEVRQSWNEVQYKEFMDSLESERLSKAVRNCMMTSNTYTADESSM